MSRQFVLGVALMLVAAVCADLVREVRQLKRRLVEAEQAAAAERAARVKAMTMMAEHRRRAAELEAFLAVLQAHQLPEVQR